MWVCGGELCGVCAFRIYYLVVLSERARGNDNNNFCTTERSCRVSALQCICIMLLYYYWYYMDITMLCWMLFCGVTAPQSKQYYIHFHNMYKCNTVVIANDVANWLSSACQRHEFTQKPYKNQTLASIKPHEAQWINVCSAVQFWSKGPRGTRLPWISYNSIYSEWLNIWGDCWLLDNSILDKMILGR